MIDGEKNTISEDELHAFVDDQLSDERKLIVQAWLKDNSEDAEKVAAWKKQNAAIRKLFTQPNEEKAAIDLAADEELMKLVSRRKPAKYLGGFKVWRQIAATILGATGLVAVAVGYNAYQGESEKVYAHNLPEVSRVSYSVYSGEIKHPVEVWSDEKEHLSQWLGKRINRELALPNIADEGFKLLGGRILPLKGAASAMLMYEDDFGERLTLIIGPDKNGVVSSFRYSELENIQTYYWGDSEYGYAISSRFGREKMKVLAQALHKQL
ncbi:MAG: hypothetical protein COB24_12455 [Hyphomicrobiales bacterium]|nr:MAG: hypothetical protein COB24_12455 [Hyphomicrobiales bacterium]